MTVFKVKRTVLLGVTFLAMALSNDLLAQALSNDLLAQACDELPNPQMGQVTETNGGNYPSSATYSCDEGYDLIGTATRTCDTEGAWDGSAPSCEGIVCGLLQAPDMGNITLSNDGRYPSVAHYSCDTGYALTGSATQYCTANGEWDDGSTPICEPIILSPTFVVSAYVNVKKNDIVPIRILGNADVNVRDIDKSSITLDGIHVTNKVKGNGRERFRCSFNYINDDEFEDLTCKFQTNIVACDEKVPAVLKGKIFNDGTYIEAAKFLENNTDICIDSSVE